MQSSSFEEPCLWFDSDGTLGALIRISVPDEKGGSVQYEVVVSEKDIQKLLFDLSNPPDQQTRQAVAVLTQHSLRSLVRLVALGAGVQLVN